MRGRIWAGVAQMHAGHGGTPGLDQDMGRHASPRAAKGRHAVATDATLSPRCSMNGEILYQRTINKTRCVKRTFHLEVDPREPGSPVLHIMNQVAPSVQSACQAAGMTLDGSKNSCMLHE